MDAGFGDGGGKTMSVRANFCHAHKTHPLYPVLIKAIEGPDLINVDFEANVRELAIDLQHRVWAGCHML